MSAWPKTQRGAVWTLILAVTGLAIGTLGTAVAAAERASAVVIGVFMTTLTISAVVTYVTVYRIDAALREKPPFEDDP